MPPQSVTVQPVQPDGTIGQPSSSSTGLFGGPDGGEGQGKSSSGLSGGAIAGVVIGVIVGVAVLAAAIGGGLWVSKKGKSGSHPRSGKGMEMTGAGIAPMGGEGTSAV